MCDSKRFLRLNDPVILFLLVNTYQQGEEESGHYWCLQGGTTLSETRKPGVR